MQPCRKDTAPALAPTALAPEMAMVLRLFPYDPGLKGLARATDSASMTALLATHLPECRDQGWRIVSFRQSWTSIGDEHGHYSRRVVTM